MFSLITSEQKILFLINYIKYKLVHIKRRNNLTTHLIEFLVNQMVHIIIENQDHVIDIIKSGKHMVINIEMNIKIKMVENIIIKTEEDKLRDILIVIYEQDQVY